MDLGVWQFVAGIVGIYLVARTLSATRDAVKEANDATEAAQRSIDETSRVGEAQVRAYVSVLAATFTDKERQVFGAHQLTITLNNSGSTPATNVAVFCGCEVRTFNEARAFTCPETVPFLFTVRTLPSGITEDKTVTPFGIAVAIREYAKAHESVDWDTVIGLAPALVVWGVVFYDDVFGKTFRTDYAFFFEPEEGDRDVSLYVVEARQRVMLPVQDRADHVRQQNTD